MGEPKDTFLRLSSAYYLSLCIFWLRGKSQNTPHCKWNSSDLVCYLDVFLKHEFVFEDCREQGLVAVVCCSLDAMKLEAVRT